MRQKELRKMLQKKLSVREKVTLTRNVVSIKIKTEARTEQNRKQQGISHRQQINSLQKELLL